jgi:hypothetical protein
VHAGVPVEPVHLAPVELVDQARPIGFALAVPHLALAQRGDELFVPQAVER